MAEWAASWKPMPLELIILEVLEKHNGLILDHELYAILEKEYRSLNEDDFRKALMNLEIMGRINVTLLSKNKWKISKITEKTRFLEVGED